MINNRHADSGGAGGRQARPSPHIAHQLDALVRGVTFKNELISSSTRVEVLRHGVTLFRRDAFDPW